MVIANVEMAKAWDGEEGDHWTELADRYDAAGARMWKRFLDADLIAAGDRVLDIGCGTGQSTTDAARASGSGAVLGVDLSARMLGLAQERTRAAGRANVEYLQADAQVHPFDADAYDIAISRFGAMFFADPSAAFANIARAVRPGGRLALMSWKGLAQNPWLNAIRDALAAGRDLPVPPTGTPGPFGLADPDEVRALLTGAGFDDVELVAVDELMYLGRDGDDAWDYVRQMGIVKGLTESLDDETKAEALAKLRQVIDAHATDEGVLIAAGAWLITARRA